MRFGTVGLVLMLVGCGGPLEVSLVPVDVQGAAIVSPSDPGMFNVTVENHGSSRVSWGMGSSSCQLGLVVLFTEIRHRIDFRACTADLIEHGLNGGERRTEMFTWNGEISDIEGRPFLLPDGRYRVFGTAGELGESRGLWVTVRR